MVFASLNGFWLALSHTISFAESASFALPAERLNEEMSPFGEGFVSDATETSLPFSSYNARLQFTFLPKS